MALYAWDSAHEPVQPIAAVPGASVSGLGAYYAWDSAHEPVLPINGLGDSGHATLVDEAARHLLDRRPPVSVVREWAEQKTDGVWRELPGAATLTLLAVTASELRQIRSKAHGADVQMVGVLVRRPIRKADQGLAFAGTPYTPGLFLAVYRLEDRSRVAKPEFLSLATLRGPADPDGGHDSVEHAAKRLGGRLVYVVSLPTPPGARKPGARFQEVFSTLGAIVASEASAPPAPAPAPSALSLAPYFAGGVAVAGLGWWLLSRRGI